MRSGSPNPKSLCLVTILSGCEINNFAGQPAESVCYNLVAMFDLFRLCAEDAVMSEPGFSLNLGNDVWIYNRVNAAFVVGYGLGSDFLSCPRQGIFSCLSGN